MNYNSLMNKPTINYRELIGDNSVTEVGGITEEQFNTLLTTDLASYYTKAEIDELFSRSFVYREKSGSIVTFDCPESTTSGISEVTSEIEATQDLHGYDNPWPAGGGINLLDVKNKVPSAVISGVTYVSDDNYIILNGTKSGGGYADLSSLTITLDSGTYYLKAFIISGTASETVELYTYDGSGNLTSNIIGNERDLTLTESKTFRFRFAIWRDGTVLNNYKIGIVVSKTANIDKFYPYSNICPISGWSAVNVVVSPTVDVEDGTTYTTQLKDGQDNPMTCYGGQLVNENGVQTLELTHGYIASYNGETLPSTWISDRDVYAEGTTPTTGAEVVYTLATPQQISQDNLAIASTAGVNNIWCDSGDITVKALDRIIQG